MSQAPKYLETVQAALVHVKSRFPQVTQVSFDKEGGWLFSDGESFFPDFDNAIPPIEVGLLEAAADEAFGAVTLPCAFSILTLKDLYTLWGMCRNASCSDGTDGKEFGSLKQELLHFPAGTPREDIWRWFEKQHPEFIVGEVMQGIYKPV